jgi:mutator protein MutT
MAEQLFQIGIKALIRNERGDILLLKVPAWRHNPEHWDMPGGRMEPGESFLQTLRRELQEEIGVDYRGEAKQLATVLSTVTIPVGEARVPLVIVAYEAELPSDVRIVLDENGPEQEYEWVSLHVAAQRLQSKYPDDFCQIIVAL